MSQDIRQGQVERLFGRIGLEVINKRHTRLHVDGRRLTIKTEQALALRDGDYYNLYIAPHSHVILSAEPVDVRAEDEAGVDDAGAAAAVEHLAEPVESVELEAADEKPKRERLILGDDGELVGRG